MRDLIRLRQQHRVFRRRKFFQNRAIRGETVRDIVWLDPAGTQMSDEQWRDGFARSLAVFLSGRGLDERDERGRTIVDTDFLVLVNAHYETVEFKLPRAAGGCALGIAHGHDQSPSSRPRSARSRRAIPTRCRDERWRCSSFRSRASTS